MEKRMPAIFFGHGSPMNAVDENEYARRWALIGEEIPRPKAGAKAAIFLEEAGSAGFPDPSVPGSAVSPDRIGTLPVVGRPVI